jgi:hypothetical protein
MVEINPLRITSQGHPLFRQCSMIFNRALRDDAAGRRHKIKKKLVSILGFDAYDPHIIGTLYGTPLTERPVALPPTQHGEQHGGRRRIHHLLR